MPKISAASVEEHREQMQRRVFAAFATLMAHQSFDALTMAKIAAEAGIGRTAIYHHFADKEELVVAFASHETSRYLEELQDALSVASDPVDRLGVYIRYQLEAGQRFHITLGNQLYGALSPEALLAIREHVVAIENVLHQILADGALAGQFVVDDPAATMSLIHACLAPRHLPAAVIEKFVLRALRVD